VTVARSSAPRAVHLGLQPILAGRWHDRFERDGDEWWLTERLIHPDLVRDIRFHIKGLSA
jgi:hypothetical protein